jgi:hypothetical protein
MNLKNSLNALFSFGRERPEPEMNAAAMTPMPQVMPMAAAPNPEIMATINTTSKLSGALDAMLKDLKAYFAGLPAAAGALPERNVSVVSVVERNVGLGNITGNNKRGGFAATVLKGGRLDAVARFQLWGTGPGEVDAAVEALHKALLTDKDTLLNLKKQGFLRIAAETSSLAEHVAVLNAWRKTTDYRVLYEYSYEDTDGAESLIARIPIHSDPEARNSPQRETTTVTDEMVRWDNEATPRLVVRGRLTIGSLSALAFIPATAPTGTVILKRTFDGAVGVMANFPTLNDFLNNAPATRHAQVSFASLNDFLAAFKKADEAIELGDWNLDNVPDAYKVLTLALAIELPTAADRLEVLYQNPAFDQNAVVYLRAAR